MDDNIQPKVAKQNKLWGGIHTWGAVDDIFKSRIYTQSRNLAQIFFYIFILYYDRQTNGQSILHKGCLLLI